MYGRLLKYTGRIFQQHLSISYHYTDSVFLKHGTLPTSNLSISTSNMSFTTIDKSWRLRSDSKHPAIIVPYGPAAEPQAQMLRLSYSSLGNMVNSLSDSLRLLGVGLGDAVATFYDNGLEAVLSFLAATGMRAVCAPLNPAYKEDALQFYFGDSKPKVLLMPTALTPVQQTCSQVAKRLGITVVYLDVDYANKGVRVNGKQLVADDLTERDGSVVPDPEDVALILHTSGTTSKPKGVPLTHANIMRSVSNIVKHYELTPRDSCHIVMPLFHVHGLIGCLLPALTSGGTCVVPPHKFSAARFWKTMCHCDCSWYSAVPSIHQILLKNVEQDYVQGLSDAERRKLHARWRFARSCSAALPAAVLDKLEKTFGKPWLEAYAMTEASHQMCANPLPKHGPHKAGSVGVPTGVRVVILDNAEDRVLRSPGEIGEIAVSGTNVTNGYLNRPEANKESFVRTKEEPNVVFFRTGDQGKFDSDGYLFLTGRLKEMINRGGEKIAPMEIDDTLLQHKGVNIAVAFAMPDNILGEVVAAAVVPTDPNVDKMSLEAELHNLCIKKLAKFKRPVKIFIASDVPRTATGKIQRRFVAEHFLATTSKL